MLRHTVPRVRVAAGCLALLAALSGCASAPPGGAGSAAAEVAALERARFAALERNDLATLGTMLADDLVYCHSNGRCETRGEFLEALRSGAMRYRRIAVLELRPRSVGEAVLVHGRIDLDAEMQGTAVRLQLVYTDLYARRDGRWRLVAWQSTRAPEAAAPP
jgi:ketosteroid isomerase-like protein